ncbi:CDP-glucose 4,6-dehydratase [Coprobacter sp.]
MELNQNVRPEKAFLSFYRGKKVFITGHTGFKGSWLVKILSMLGAEIKGYALPPATTPSLYHVLGIENLCTSVFGDIMDREKLFHEIIDFDPDVVFHLAAQPLVRLSYDIPAETFAVNAIGTAHVLDAVCKVNKPCTAVLITTDKVYHNNEWEFPYRENDRLGGYDPYSASKACAELVIDSYRNSFFNRKDYVDHRKSVISARAGNVIGGGDWAKDRLIPDIVRALHAGTEIVLRNPAAIRPWQHVLEPLSGYLLLGCSASSRYEQLSDAYNFGPNPEDTLTVEQMTVLATNIWGAGKFQTEQSASAPHEAGLLKLDISLAKAQLDWSPGMNAHEALELTLQWYKTYYQDNENISALTERQIEYFFSK